jgi:type III secretion protein U
MSDSAEEKVFDPSSKKLRKLREDGQVPRSKDFTGALVLIVMLAYLIMRGGDIYARLKLLMSTIPFTHPINFHERLVIALHMTGGITAEILLPFIAILFIAIVASNIIDTSGFLFTLSSLAPNFAKFNPMTGIKQIFSLKSLIELIKGIIKLVILLWGSWIIVKKHMNDIFWSPTCGLPCVLGVGGSVAMQIIAFGVLLLLIGAAIDFALQRYLFTQDQRMTLTEMKQEQKENSGDPHVNNARRRLRNELAQTAGLVGINKANVIFRAPGMVVAIAYKPELAGVPIVAAKGSGAKADELLKKAQENKAHIVDDAEITAILMAEGRVGDVIPKPTFSPIARILLRLGLVKRN